MMMTTILIQMLMCETHLAPVTAFAWSLSNEHLAGDDLTQIMRYMLPGIADSLRRDDPPNIRNAGAGEA